MADKKNPDSISVEGAIRSTNMVINTLEAMGSAYRGKPEAERYRQPTKDLKVVLSILKGYREDSASGKPLGLAQAALREACEAAARDLGEVKPGLSAAYETLPDRIEGGPLYGQKGESAFGAPEIVIWLISFAIIYGILRNANIF